MHSMMALALATMSGALELVLAAALEQLRRARRNPAVRRKVERARILM